MNLIDILGIWRIPSFVAFDRKKKKKHRTTEQVQPEEDPQAVILDPAARRWRSP